MTISANLSDARCTCWSLFSSSTTPPQLPVEVEEENGTTPPILLVRESVILGADGNNGNIVRHVANYSALLRGRGMGAVAKHGTKDPVYYAVLVFLDSRVPGKYQTCGSRP